MDSKIKKISDWISEQGYPLEMYCENILTQNGFSVIQSLNYEDDETKKFREIDILATKYKLHNGVTFNFSIVIECKLSKDKPWLLFARKQHKDYQDEIIHNAYTTHNGRLLIKESTDISKISLLSYDGDKIGFNITQCFTTGKDVPYQATMSTANACEYLVNKSNDSMRKFCNFYFPVVVIDSELYKCYTDTSGEIKIESSEIEKLLLVRSYSDRSSILYTIVTKNGFKTFAEKLSIEMDELFDKLQPAFQKVSDQRPSNSRYNVL